MLSLVSSLVAALVCLAPVQAAPAPSTALQPRAISEDLLDTFNLFEQYSAAAYCPSNSNGTNTKLLCSVGNCPRVEKANTTILLQFENSLLTDVTGYVAVDYTNELVVVAFRGSTSIRNYLADVDFPLILTDICVLCFADSGFWTSWLEAREKILTAIKILSEEFPTYQIVTTGHSLGAAIADFAAAELRNDGYNVKLYTYGSPRVGDLNISNHITKQGQNWRITHYNDPVPQLPPIILGFVHVSPEYWITSGNNATVTAEDIKGPINGSVNFSGNTGKVSLDIDAHLWYFNRIASCYEYEGVGKEFK
ncbi:alpha/beta-hydrolase [Saccharata proteae CBS 121410]|uniref:Alpha/beta-hydrolase n=1 Tax=Saccharata proteae CBS 121410 TaxID=1314787 RepID=A0A9P4I2Y9_9PEZI|nr:alpha/beta-hydrolase [Saccharata proteae CBS 121410]